jgi:adenine-specific DNA-methyltransferase
MVQGPEQVSSDEPAYRLGYRYITEIGKERIRRAGKKIIEAQATLINAARAGTFETGEPYAEWTTGDTAKKTQAEVRSRLDIGFRVLKLDSSNMKDVYYKPDQLTVEALLGTADNIKEDRTPEDLLFQVMLDLGVLLSSKIEEQEIAGKKVFNVAEGFLIACFDAILTFPSVF